MGMYAALRVVQWVVGKALAPVAGMLGAWAATKNFGPNVEALSTELLLVKATLEQAALKEFGGPAMEEVMHKLWDSAHNAEDLLDELDYFRIHDVLHGTYEAADEHGKGCICSLALNARHTAKAVGKLVNCCAWQRAKRAKRRQRAKPEFNRIDFSKRMKDIVEKLQLMRNEVRKILIHCGPRTVPDIAQIRPITKGRIDEPKLYGRDRVMNSIIHDSTKGQYCDKGLTVLPVVGPGGMGKTTLIQHIYRSQQVQNHYSVMIWVCVSLNFNLDKVLEQIKTCTPEVENEKKNSTTEELIEQRLKSKRFLLVLDDLWHIINGDDWAKLLSTLKKSEENGSMILVTTRFQATAEEVKAIDHSIKLDGLESEEFRKLFFAFVFGDEQCPRDKHFLLETGDKIMEKLKGSPLAAKMVGRLLSKDLSLLHWKRVLKSKRWEEQTDGNEIMPALKLSYDFLPLHLQQCFGYSGLFPEDYNFRSDELIRLWIGLDILIHNGQNQTFEDIGLSNLNELVTHEQDILIHNGQNQTFENIGLSNLNELVTHGFFREEETEYGLRYVMHDLLHDLALKVASHDCLSLRLSDVGPMEIQPSICHLSISMDDLGEYDAVFAEKLKSKLEELKTRFKVEHLQTLMLFGEMDEGFVKIFGDFFGEVNALRVLHLPSMVCPVESMLHNFSGLVHLRYLCLGTKDERMHLPRSISKFYHLRILHLELWLGSHDLPKDMSNLAKLCHFYVPSGDQLHFHIYNVGIGKMASLRQLWTIDLRKCAAASLLKELAELPHLKEIAVVSSDEQEDARMNNALFCSLNKSIKQRSRVVYSAFRLNTAQSSSPNKYLNYWKKHSPLPIFLKVPICIAGHHLLGMLDIRVCKLEEDGLKILRELPRLHILIVRLEVLPTKMIRISCEGFGRLESFCVDCRMPRVIFEDGTMPKLQHLELKLYGGTASEEQMGMKHLLQLQNVTLRYAKWYATNKGVRETAEAVKTECKEHPNEITLCVAEEDKDSECTMETEIFQENRVASCSRMTEVEEKEDTQEGSLDESSCANASCSGTGEIEEVVEYSSLRL